MGALAVGAQAQTVVHVTPGNMQGWVDVTSENSNGGHAAITGVAYDGNGSVAATGDRDRFVLGGVAGLYGDPATDGLGNNLGKLSDFTNLSFSYMVDPTSVSSLYPLYGPALRIVFYDSNGVKDELVFEQAYQTGGYGSAAPAGTWNVTSDASLFYDLNATKVGNGSAINDDRTISQWVTDLGIGDDVVGGIYVGVGSGTGSGTLVHFDNIIAGDTEYKFDLSAGAVPEPETWALMILGLGGAGAALRRRKATARPATA
ncbi:MAG: PEPxxWA-CTERM sorting domain-containing protein [Proteobacteria bacterium]|nr:PEPxxWA-CTERM sorting domain-containing protein [Pseudomonadota bacterium]